MITHLAMQILISIKSGWPIHNECIRVDSQPESKSVLLFKFILFINLRSKVLDDRRLMHYVFVKRLTLFSLHKLIEACLYLF